VGKVKFTISRFNGMGKLEIYQQVELKLKNVEIELVKKQLICKNFGNILVFHTTYCQIIIACGIEENKFTVTVIKYGRRGLDGRHAGYGRDDVYEDKMLTDVTFENFVSNIIKHVESYLQLID